MRARSSAARRSLFLAAIAATSPAAFAQVAVSTWDGQGDNNWATPANWVGNVLPTSGSYLEFNGPGVIPHQATNNNIVGGNFLGMTFQGDLPANHTVGGNGFSLGEGGITSSSILTINVPVTLASDQQWHVWFGGLTLSGPLSNAAGVTEWRKSGAYGVALTANNPLTAAVRIKEGSLRLSGANGAITSAAGLVVSQFLSLDNTTLNANRLGDAPTHFLQFVGGRMSVDGNNWSETIGGNVTVVGESGIQFNGSNGELTLNGLSTSSAGGALEIFATGLGTTNRVRVIGQAAGYMGGSIYAAAGAISDLAVYDTTQNSVRAMVDGATVDDYAAAVTLTSGRFSRPTADVNQAAPITVRGLKLGSGIDVTGAATVTLGGVTEPVILKTGGGAATVANPITLTASRTHVRTHLSSETLNLDGAISGGAGSVLYKNGAGTLVLRGANTYAGATVVLDGTLRTAGAGRLLGDLFLHEGARFDPSANEVDVIRSITFSRGGDVSATGEVRLSLASVNGAAISVPTSEDLVDTATLGNVGLNGGERLFSVGRAIDRTVDLDVLGNVTNHTGNGTMIVQSSTPEPGIVRIGGSASNTGWGGGTLIIRSGTVLLAKPVAGVLAVGGSGQMFIGEAAGTIPAQLRYDTVSDQILNNAITVFPNGTFNLNGFDETTGGTFVFQGGTLDLGPGGEMTVGSILSAAGGGVVTSTGGGGILRVEGPTHVSVGLLAVNAPVVFGDPIPDVRVDPTLPNTGVTYAAGLAGAGFNKIGNGTMRITGTSPGTFAKAPVVSAGVLALAQPGSLDHAIDGDVVIGDGLGGVGVDVLRVEQPEQLPSTPGHTVVVNSSGILRLEAPETLRDLQLNGGRVQSLNGGVLRVLGTLSSGGTAVSLVTGVFDLAAGPTEFNVADAVTTGAGVDLDISGASFSGGSLPDGTIRKRGLGTMLLPNVPSLAAIDVQEGTVLAFALFLKSGASGVSPGATLQTNSVTVNAGASLTQGQNANIIGTVNVKGSFSAAAGTLDGGIVNDGAVHLSGGTLDVTGPITNNGAVTLPAGARLDARAGFANDADVFLSGGTLSAAANAQVIRNNSLIQGFGTINGLGSFHNNAILNVVGGNLAIATETPSLNAGTIDVAVARQLRLQLGEFQNQGTIRLNGSTINGAGVLNNLGQVAGHGTVATTFVNGGTLLVSGGTMNLAAGVNNTELILLDGPNARIIGPSLVNNGRLQGDGQVASPVTNNGRIEPDGTLALASVLNNPAGLLTARAGHTLIATVATNNGVISLNGGAIDLSDGPVNNLGQISGHGTLSTAGLTNNGSVTLTGGFTTIHGGVTNAAGRTIEVAHTPALFTGDVVNNGIFKNTGTTVTFAGTYTENGAFISDPADNLFANLVVAESGYLVGGHGDRFLVAGDFLPESMRADAWETSSAELVMRAGDGERRLAVVGEDRGISAAGYEANFAWRRLVLPGEGVWLEDGNDTPGGAIYVRELAVNLSDIDRITGNGLSIYYDVSDPANAYLGGETYALAGGGVIAAVPEPGVASVVIGLAGVAWGRRRRPRAGA